MLESSGGFFRTRVGWLTTCSGDSRSPGPQGPQPRQTRGGKLVKFPAAGFRPMLSGADVSLTENTVRAKARAEDTTVLTVHY